ncbi:MAG: 50S ribosomal protein L4 [bacterium]|nr:50S ribosomal protein L4 [bacterium]
MKTDLYNQQGEVISQIDLPDEIFGLKVNNDLVHQAMVAQLGNSRQVLAHTKDRSEVRGGGKKPWRQKGTGRARHGSIRSPIWKGGGVTFGPTKERNFSKSINKKMKRKALFMALSSKASSQQLMVLESLSIEKPKTKLADQVIKGLSSKMKGYKASKKKRDSLVLVLPDTDKAIEKSTRNLDYTKVLSAKSLNILDILNNKYLLLTQESIPAIQKHYKI